MTTQTQAFRPTTQRHIEVAYMTADGETRWTALYPSREAVREYHDLIRRVGDWHEEVASDVIGAPTLPDWVVAAERRIEELGKVVGQLNLNGSQPRELRARDGNLVLHVEVRNTASGNDASCMEPTGKFEATVRAELDGRQLADGRTWVHERDIFAARDQWRDTGDVRELVYDLAAFALNAAHERFTPRGSTGYGTYR